MAVSLLRRFAAGAPVPFLPLSGEGAGDALGALELHPDLLRVDSPRHATLLVLAGEFPERTYEALQRLHDQMPHPRAAVRWDGAPIAALPEAVAVASDEDPIGDPDGARALRDLGRDVVRGRRRSSAALLPDEPPAPWRGRGDHGQGGEGMMGGRPYGRPMAMTADDLRDGLSLDRLAARLGPFYPGLPPGLVLHLVLQGDVVQEAKVEAPPFAAAVPPPFRRVLDEPVPVAELERARARHHLGGVATMLRMLGVPALAELARRAAGATTRTAAVRLCSFLRRTRAVEVAVPEGLGRLSRDEAAAWGGPTARAAGHVDDARTEMQTYRRLGLTAVSGDAGDVRARLWQRLNEAEESLVLAARANAQDAKVGPLRHVEAPEGPLGGTTTYDTPGFEALCPLLAGREWGEALLVLASFPPPRRSA